LEFRGSYPDRGLTSVGGELRIKNLEFRGSYPDRGLISVGGEFGI
jgi:hypothetical protein